jgi:ADP-ribose pyrophosphatase YjhB (NUDIX family)
MKFNNAVGVLFFAKDTRRNLFLLRNTKKYSVWALPGGKVERGESLKQALARECTEEIQYWPENSKLFPIEKFTSEDQKFSYHTFYCIVDNEFIPVLNHEHIGYSWCDQNHHPLPLHSGLLNTLTFDTIKQKIQIIQESMK